MATTTLIYLDWKGIKVRQEGESFILTGHLWSTKGPPSCIEDFLKITMI